MYALTIKQPWADAIVHSEKRIENRTWPAPGKDIGSQLLLHAGKTYDLMGRFHIDRSTLNSWPDTRGAVIAIATLAGCHFSDGCCTAWGLPRTWHWELTDIQPLTTPVSCPGAQRLWTPSPSVREAVASDPAVRTTA